MQCGMSLIEVLALAISIKFHCERAQSEWGSQTHTCAHAHVLIISLLRERPITFASHPFAFAVFT